MDNPGESSVPDIVSFRHLALIGFVEVVRVEHDQAEREDVRVV